jgi:hypothetical protein
MSDGLEDGGTGRAGFVILGFRIDGCMRLYNNSNSGPLINKGL